MSFIPGNIYFDGLCFKADEKCLLRRNQRVCLTAKESQILAILLDGSGRVVAKNELGNALWPGCQMDPDCLFHHVSSLRKKLRKAGIVRPCLENISKVGYRFVGEVTRVSPGEISVSADLASALSTHRETSSSESAAVLSSVPFPRRLSERRVKKWHIGAGLALVFATTVLLNHRGLLRINHSPTLASGTLSDFHNQPTTSVLISQVITSPEIVPSPRVITRIHVGRQPTSILIANNGRYIYVSELQDDSVSIIDSRTNQVIARVAVGHKPMVLVSSKDGQHVYIAQAGGGIGILDTLKNSFYALPRFNTPVTDLVLTHDGSGAYLAVGFHGLAKLDLNSEIVNIISPVVYPRALALTPDGKALYVSYQAGGPGGSFGHDAIGYFDTTTDQLAGTIKGIPNVGECLSVSPNESQVWENGEDACDSPQYDHVGCPAIPAGLLNIVSVSTHKLVRSVGFRGARLQCVTFAPNGKFAAISSTNHLMLLRSGDLALLGSIPVGSSGRIAFTLDGFTAYVPLTNEDAVAVIQIGITINPIRLTNRHEADGSIPIAIPSTPEFDAKSVDPSSLRLEGQPVNLINGMNAVSIEQVAGFEGHSLIAYFKLAQLKASGKLTLTGTTYEGFPIKGLLNSF